MRVVESIKKIYPNIKGGFVYWETKQDGTTWENPIDGLVWENAEYAKPTWEQIEANFILSDTEILRASKISICKSYLDRTDWKPIRELDLVGSYQESDKLNRNLARIAINDLEALTTLEEVEAYDITKFI